jgi:predicted alpha/beta superfamily hydrolase
MGYFTFFEGYSMKQIVVFGERWVVLTGLFFLTLMHSMRAQVTFHITQWPNYTPPADTLYIAGTFNGWNPGSAIHRLTRQPDSSWMITLPPSASSIQFKFTRGNWAKVEGNATGTQRPNRNHTFGSADTVRITIESWEDLHQGGGGGGSTANAQVIVLTDSFYIPQLQRHRRIWMYLPVDYNTALSKRYPVFYMHDGQNLFDASTAFAGEWEVDEHISRLFGQGDDGAIVVGISNGGAQRINEYSPWINPQYGGGQGEDYMNFIVQTLKPYIDSHYRTDSSRASTGLWGSSMGGLISQFGVMRHQEVFGMAGVFSPSLWFSSQVFAQIPLEGRRQPTRFYLLAGALESSSLVAQTQQLAQSLRSVGFDSTDIAVRIRSDGQHSEWFWRREFPEAYRWLLRRLPTSVATIAKPDLRWYPNPTARHTRLLGLEEFEETELRIVDACGRLRFTGVITTETELETSSWSPGVYTTYVVQQPYIRPFRLMVH